MPQVDRIQIRLRKRGKKFTLQVQEHREDGTSANLGPTWVSEPQLDYLYCLSRHSQTDLLAWQEHPGGSPVFTPHAAPAATRNTAAKRNPLQLTFERESSPGSPSVSREHGFLVFRAKRPLCSVLRYHQVRFLSQESNI